VPVLADPWACRPRCCTGCSTRSPCSGAMSTQLRRRTQVKARTACGRTVRMRAGAMPAVGVRVSPRTPLSGILPTCSGRSHALRPRPTRSPPTRDRQPSLPCGHGGSLRRGASRTRSGGNSPRPTPDAGLRPRAEGGDHAHVAPRPRVRWVCNSPRLPGRDPRLSDASGRPPGARWRTEVTMRGLLRVQPEHQPRLVARPVGVEVGHGVLELLIAGSRLLKPHEIGEVALGCVDRRGRVERAGLLVPGHDDLRVQGCKAV
jgi:hypothetical protein